MSDRKYRQRGYQDEGRREKGSGPAKPAGKPPRDMRPETRAERVERNALEGRVPNMPGFREVVRCARCGNVITDLAIAADSRCKRCGADLRTCAQCESFDTSARFECHQTIPARISPKDVRNTCTLFSPRVTVERETHSQPQAPNSAKKAFDDLFK
jgi:NAD-dependent SIR2 family protein deacetylase